MRRRGFVCGAIGAVALCGTTARGGSGGAAAGEIAFGRSQAGFGAAATGWTKTVAATIGAGLLLRQSREADDAAGAVLAEGFIALAIASGTMAALLAGQVKAAPGEDASTVSCRGEMAGGLVPPGLWRDFPTMAACIEALERCVSGLHRLVATRAAWQEARQARDALREARQSERARCAYGAFYNALEQSLRLFGRFEREVETRRPGALAAVFAASAEHAGRKAGEIGRIVEMADAALGDASCLGAVAPQARIRLLETPLQRLHPSSLRTARDKLGHFFDQLEAPT